jgi:CcmD family protein
MMPTFTNEWNFVYAAYVVAWIALGGYSIYLARLTRRAEQEYEAARVAAADTAGRGR